MDRRIVVVGASLAGLRVAQTLRRLGYDGLLTVVDPEPAPSYDHPPLSKGYLTGTQGREDIALDTGGLEADWAFDTAVRALDTGRRRIELADGTELPYDGLVIASGANARRPEWTDELHRRNGVRVIPGASASGVFGRERVEGVRLSTGESLSADVVCDGSLRTSVDGVVAAGDVVSWPNPLAGDGAQRVEPVGWPEWSDGTPVVEEGGAGVAAAEFYRAGLLVGAVTVDDAVRLARYRATIMATTNGRQPVGLRWPAAIK